uniref:Tetratricopeptide repeat protein n=1 Tax=Eutreptiella gymnastica TaxID=73025 RepID=A0A7S1NDL2_9EUGL|mmetsp:Transcript_19718/g.35102  ORF Transcript_19718/g.35102 Transcript_19718/m.35102 type:complete len:456 (+) Transcript_19718:172-1539(+)
MYPEEEIMSLERRLHAEGTLENQDAESLIVKLNLLAQVHFNDDNLDLSEEVLLRAAELTDPARLYLFQDNDELAMTLRVKTLSALAVLARMQGDKDRAIQYLKNILHIEQHYHKQQPQTNLNMATLLNQSGRHFEALNPCSRCIRLLKELEMERALTESQKVTMASALYQLAIAKDRCNRPAENAEAAQAYQDALAYSARALGSEHPVALAQQKEFHEHPSKIPALPPIGAATTSPLKQSAPRAARPPQSPWSLSAARPSSRPTYHGQPMRTMKNRPVRVPFCFPADIGIHNTKVPDPIAEGPMALRLHPHNPLALVPTPPDPLAPPGTKAIAPLPAGEQQRLDINAADNTALQREINQDYATFRQLRRRVISEGVMKQYSIHEAILAAMAGAIVCGAQAAVQIEARPAYYHELKAKPDPVAAPPADWQPAAPPPPLAQSYKSYVDRRMEMEVNP